LSLGFRAVSSAWQFEQIHSLAAPSAWRLDNSDDASSAAFAGQAMKEKCDA